MSRRSFLCLPPPGPTAGSGAVCRAHGGSVHLHGRRPGLSVSLLRTVAPAAQKALPGPHLPASSEPSLSEARRHGPAQGPGAPAGAVPGGEGGPCSGSRGGRRARVRASVTNALPVLLCRPRRLTGNSFSRPLPRRLCSQTGGDRSRKPGGRSPKRGQRGAG